MKLSSVSLTALAITISLFNGCKKDGGSGSSSDHGPGGQADGGAPDGGAPDGGDPAGTQTQVTFSGTLAIDANVTSAVAIEVQGGGIESGGPVKSTEAPVESSGAFTVALDTTSGMSLSGDDGEGGSATAGSSEAMILLIDSSKSDPLDQIVGFAGMGAGGESLIRMPLGMKDGADKVELGSLTADKSGDFSSSGSLAENAEKFAVDSKVLDETARIDSIARHVKNTYANQKPDGTYYRANPFYIIGSDALEAVGKFSDVTKMKAGVEGAPGGFGIYFGSNDPKVSFDKICAAASDPKHALIEIFPPGPVSTGDASVTFDTTKPMSNAATSGPQQSSGYQECFAETFYANGDGNFNVGGGGFKSSMPDGKWVVKVEGAQVAAFDLAAARPFDDKGIPTVYLPALKIIAGSGNKIAGFEVKWYIFDRDTAEYKEVTDLAAFLANVGEFTVGVTDYSGPDNHREEALIKSQKPASGHVFAFDAAKMESHAGGPYTKGFLLPGQTADGQADAESISVNYKLSGISFLFDFRPVPVNP